MNAKVQDLMTESVVTTEQHRTIDHVRGIMERNKIGVIPIVDSDGRAKGIVSATDLVPELNGRSPIGTIMSAKVHTVPEYDEVSTAARVMRNHRVHHLIVTREKQVVGVVSAFDLLRLVEDHRYVAKPAPTRSKRKGSKRV
jgi:signal-transduction protein with cAMP-binding, CBS, and nucleotidyltransferase domain